MAVCKKVNLRAEVYVPGEIDAADNANSLEHDGWWLCCEQVTFAL